MTSAWQNKRCRIVCLVGFIFNEKSKCEVFEGIIEGEIVPPRGQFGFGFDSCFQPDTYNRTLAEMSQTEKDAISHRGLAFRAFKDYVVNKLNK